MESKRNLCAQIPETLHARVRSEQEQLGQTLSQYVEQILTEYYQRKEGKTMNENTRTLAFQVSEERFGRLKAYLAAHGLKQKEFVIGLIEQALEGWENAQENPDGSEV